MHNYLPFVKARKFVHSLRLNSAQQFRDYCQSGDKPDNIPTAPNTVYKNKGWSSWGDWCGNNNIAEKYKVWKTFDQARRLARSLHLTGFEEWEKHCKSGKKPKDIPTAPDTVYKKEWKGWGDFLGTGNVWKKEYRSYNKARKFAREHKIKSEKEWRNFKRTKRPNDLPYNPDRVYKEWISWSDFLGPRPSQWKSFKEARKFAQSLKLTSPREWSKFSKSKKRPNGIPAGPFQVYKNEWKGWGDFLGTGNLNSQQLREQYYSYDNAKKYVQKQGIKTVPKFYEWSSQGKRPVFIPARPQKFYKEWIDWDDFFGREKIVIRSFDDARKYAQSLHLNFNSDWMKLHKQGKIPKDIPRYVNETYAKQGWKGWGDFLGTGNLSPKSTSQKYIKNIVEAKIEARRIAKKVFGNRVIGEEEWMQAHREGKIPDYLPRDLRRFYYLSRRKK